VPEDIRDKAFIRHEDIIGLNFILNRRRYVFRRHYRQGLRSHIIEVLDPAHVEAESQGFLRNGIRWYPKAIPLKMLRIFRLRFSRIEEVFDETRKLRIVEQYLGPKFLAVSSEFVVDYIGPDKRDFILCGLQDFVKGRGLDPWQPFNEIEKGNFHLRSNDFSNEEIEKETMTVIDRIQKNAANFIDGIKRMVLEANYVPDLAGVRNILLTPCGNIRLVDINNISYITFDSQIKVDDKGYPVCDKSIEALAQLEQNLLNRSINMREKIYKVFLEPERMKAVAEIENRFRKSKRFQP